MALVLFDSSLILVRGGGDVASGVVYRLHKAGFPVVISELPTPMFVRRAVCYGEAVYSQQITIDGLTAQRVNDVDSCYSILDQGQIPVTCDPTKDIINSLKPVVIVDGRIKKYNPDTTRNDAPLVIALGPGYTAGVDCHAIVETNRGHNLGRVITQGMAEPDTGQPGKIEGYTHSRVLRAPADGYIKSLVQIGDSLAIDQPIAMLGDMAITAPFKGVLRGLVHPALYVTKGMKIGDIDPRSKRENCFTISDKSLAVGGGVLEAVLASKQIRQYLQVTDETPSSI